ncbi:MAG: DUF29 domain-containing protein [Nitrospirae bacterium]|uniref:DUF29 domain-containing protein n=1 Tax=Candidatus Magnetobacterium casense TaxID=1455061 RepID=UPI00069704F3|nr:DUF29 domain-containing protein [Candidatus Magnetobacterium casensis]MBF0336249.1 DUF29 domain-containing protein [Nitrospirota bacterium]
MDTLTHNDALRAHDLYEVDFYQWAFHNADLLRQGRFTEIDLENIVEELEGMARNNKRELLSRLKVLIMHLLKWQYQPNRRSRSWRETINNQRVEINFLLDDNPSLKYKIEAVIAKGFIEAKLSFEDETGISAKELPETCPYTFGQIMERGFRPE